MLYFIGPYINQNKAKVYVATIHEASNIVSRNIDVDYECDTDLAFHSHRAVLRDEASRLVPDGDLSVLDSG